MWRRCDWWRVIRAAVWLLAAFAVGVLAQDDLPRIEAFDGVDMAYVPSGCFIMGSDTDNPNESPAHEVCIPYDYWIDRYTVSNAQMAAFDYAPEQPSTSGGDDMPRNRIMWIEAVRYCELRGGRLPSEAEWEYAARGATPQRYAWGDTFTDEAANVCDGDCPLVWADAALSDGYAGLAPVDAFPAGASWVGAEQMAGNVWNWTNTAYDTRRFPYPYNADDGRESALIDGEAFTLRVLRGGAYDDTADGVRVTVRTGHLNYYDTRDNIGFRCVRDITP
jgi:formylglycine-generating enzyme required for sulfatase activity